MDYTFPIEAYYMQCFPNLFDYTSLPSHGLHSWCFLEHTLEMLLLSILVCHHNLLFFPSKKKMQVYRKNKNNLIIWIGLVWSFTWKKLLIKNNWSITGLLYDISVQNLHVFLGWWSTFIVGTKWSFWWWALHCC